MQNEALLVQTLVELADTLVDDFDVVDLLTLLADRCVEVLDVSAAGLMLVSSEGDLRVVALLQRGDADRGAVRAAVRRRALRRLLPKWHGDRQPEPRGFRQALAPIRAVAIKAGFGSAHALPMRLRGSVIGALNLFRADFGELEDNDMFAAQALADVATIAILQHRVGSTRTW